VSAQAGAQAKPSPAKNKRKRNHLQAIGQSQLMEKGAIGFMDAFKVALSLTYLGLILTQIVTEACVLVCHCNN
jgi:hypothetical protein